MGNGQPPPLAMVDILSILLFLFIYLPWIIGNRIIRHICCCGERDQLSLKDDLIRSLFRIASEVISTNVLLNAADRTGKQALESLRYGHLRKNIFQSVQRDRFAGYWLNRGLSPTPTEPGWSDVVIYYIHGGGYTLGHPADNLVDLLFFAEVLLNNGITCSIFSLDYSLAPGSCLPMQITEAIAAYQYLIKVESIHPSKIVVMGESAGGHLALSFLAALQRPGLCPHLETVLPKPQYAIILSPWIDLINSHSSISDMQKRDFLSKRALDKNSHQVLRDTPCEQKRLVVNFAERVDIRGSWKHILPKRTWITAGGDEIFLEDIKDFTKEADKDGADICLLVAEGKAHAWQTGEAFADRKRLLATAISLRGEGMEGYAAMARLLIDVLKKSDLMAGERDSTTA
ncbi:Alpha/Beta hydrolase protein [Aspergillus welwitschiae]|uniref:Alpha/Beta hydrolase protein n=1 Tax=Aspergillus welwitschiae TaxID=1341132 RepID=A0A3F3PML8_9EURO|nr:Alpha/Beta hydrolase protein [Aspergillus welwitschiae]RDH28083.1 Alpha/Beta hydrolase protein [Aspergillus welwitschiae]